MLKFRNRGVRSRQQRRKSSRSVWVLIMLVLGFSSFCGWTLSLNRGAASMAAQSTAISAQTAPDPQGTVDAVPQTLQLAQETYLARCATCHIGIPPAVLPTESWKNILEDDNHYGVPWTPLRNPDLALAWKYVRTYSRPNNPTEDPPYRIARSQYFKILHPKVKFAEPVKIGTCVSCHPSVSRFNFRDLSPQWQNSP
ncbi:cytochrome C [Altericista sp. CCNU0014]|uniref:cytochrome C n=1 Tax=Altericista sp. CCNU0014 TaxID=3082949 RepID=UPI00384EDA85